MIEDKNEETKEVFPEAERESHGEDTAGNATPAEDAVPEAAAEDNGRGKTEAAEEPAQTVDVPKKSEKTSGAKSRKKAIKEKVEKEKENLEEKAKKLNSELRARLKIPSRKSRSAEIVSVFAKHNFYIAGFSPVELKTTLEDLGPTYVKIGQIMSSRNDILPEPYCAELRKLRSSVKPLDPDIVRSTIESETGKKIGEIYKEFNDKPLGSASIAQAHYGVLLDGTPVVTKVQRPFIGEMMMDDFKLLKKLASAVAVASEVEGASSYIDLKSVIVELEKVTREELDFRIEAENTRQFRESCIEDDSVISCPSIIDDLTTERMLTMTFVDGYSIAKKEKVEADGYDKQAIAKAIFENYMHQVLDVGTFHGDPHQGNIMISHGVPYWIDFGMIGHVSPQVLGTFEEIIFALIQKDSEALTDAALTIGVTTQKINKGKLNEDVEALINKYLSVKTLSGIDVGAVMLDLSMILGDYHIKVPGEYTMLVRSLVTMEGVIVEFCPEFDLFKSLAKMMLKRAKENFDIKEKLTSAFEAVMTTGMRASKVPALTFDALKNLVKGRTKINFEISGYDDMIRQIGELAKNIVIAAFACVLFLGSCMLSGTAILPQANGIPVVAMLGFVLSISMAIYAVFKMTVKKKK